MATHKCEIKVRRTQAQITLEKLAQSVGITEPTARHIERGGDVKLSTAKAIARFLKTQVADLWPEVSR